MIRWQTVQKSTLRLYAICIFVLVTTYFNIYNLLMLNNPVNAVKLFIRNGLYQYHNISEIYFMDGANASYSVPQNNEVKLEEMVTTMYGLLSGMNSLGYLLASMFVPFISGKVGRRNGLIVAAINQIFATGMLTAAFAIGVVPMAFVARLLQGCSFALSGTLLTCFISEVPPPRHRGTIASLALPIMALIQILVLSLGNPMVFGTLQGLPILASIVLIPAALTIVVMPFVPETPPWLLLNGRDISQYSQSLLFYVGAENADNANLTQNEETPLLLGSGRVRADIVESTSSHFAKLIKSLMCKEFIIGFAAIQSAHQYSATVVMLAYSTSILEATGFSDHIAESITSVMPVVFLGFAVVSIPIFKVAPRRPFMLTAASVQLFEIIIFIISNTYVTYVEPNKFAEIIGAGCILVYTSTSLVMIPLAWLIAAELMSQSNRGSGTTNMLVVGMFEMVSLFVYTSVASRVGYGVAFIPFVCLALPGLVVLFKYLPETRECILS